MEPDSGVGLDGDRRRDTAGDALLRPDATTQESCVEDLALGREFGCVGRADGQVWCWGDNGGGQLGDPDAGARRIDPGPVLMGGVPLSGAVQVAAGGSHACARTDAGVVVCWGLNTSGQLGHSGGPAPEPFQIDGVMVTDATYIGLGTSQTCVVRSDGSVVCAGLNNSGQLGDGTEEERTGTTVVVTEGGGSLAGAMDVQHSSFHGCSRSTSGVVCWGRSDNGQLGDGTSPATPRAGVVSDLANLDSDPVVGLFVGFQSTCVTRGSGQTWCWGELESFGLSPMPMTFLQTSPPVQVEQLPDAVGIAGGIGGDHVCVITRGAQLSCFGRNNVGQLGDGTVTPRSAAALVQREGGVLENVAMAVVNQNNTCALTAGGQVYCAGSNSGGQLARASDERSTRAVAIDVPCSGG